MKQCITVSLQVRTAEFLDFEPRFIYLRNPRPDRESCRASSDNQHYGDKF